jgi:hypothetical protein
MPYFFGKIVFVTSPSFHTPVIVKYLVILKEIPKKMGEKENESTLFKEKVVIRWWCECDAARSSTSEGAGRSLKGGPRPLPVRSKEPVFRDF